MDNQIKNKKVIKKLVIFYKNIDDKVSNQIEKFDRLSARVLLKKQVVDLYLNKICFIFTYCL